MSIRPEPVDPVPVDTLRLATAAFERLRDDLHARGLGIRQWTRDLIIPRDWR